MFCTLHFGELNDGVTLELESGKQWVPREKFQPGARAGKGGKGSKSGKGKNAGKGKGKRNAFTVKVKDVGSDDVREVVIDEEIITAILGLQGGTVQKVGDASVQAEISDDAAKQALNQLVDFTGQ